MVDATYPNTTIPTQFVQDGQIVLNISPSAVAQFAMDNQEISFNARFGGQPMRVVVPVGAVLAIYARENGEGTVFTQDLIDEDDYFDDEDENQDHIEVQVAESEVKPADKKKGSHLRVIK